MTRRLTALVFALLLAARAPAVPADAPSTGGAPGSQSEQTAPASADRAACDRRGGRMRRVGMMGSWQCIVKYADAGKPCTDGDQCRGDCRADPALTLREGDPARGVCQVNSDRFGCFTRIEDGRAEPTLCID